MGGGGPLGDRRSAKARPNLGRGGRLKNLSILVPTLAGGARLGRLYASIPSDAAGEILVLAGPRAILPDPPGRIRRAVRTIRSRRRLWTSEALDGLLRAARGDYALFLNDDVVLRAGSAAVFAAAARPGRSYAGKILDRTAPRVVQAAGMVFFGGVGAQRGFGEIDGPRFDRAEENFSAGGPAFLYAREEVLAAGGFDATLRAYHEDTDLGIRFRARGGAARYLPDAEALHEGAASFVLYSSVYAEHATCNAVRIFARLPRAARRELWPRMRRWTEGQILRFAALGRARAALTGLDRARRSAAAEPEYRIGAEEILRWARPPAVRPLRVPDEAGARHPLGILGAGALPAARLFSRWRGRDPKRVRPASARGFDPAEADRYPRFRRLVVAMNDARGVGYANCLLLARRIADRVETVGPDGKIRPAPRGVEAAYDRERARIARARRASTPLLNAIERMLR